MGKNAAVAVLDAPLDAIATGTELYYCEGEPANRAAAITQACHAAPIALAAGDFGKSTVGSTRRLTVAAKSVTANQARTVNHVAICSGTALLYVTTCAAQSSNAGALVNSAAFTIDMPPPV